MRLPHTLQSWVIGRGVTQMISRIKAKILNSGIFRLDQEYHPIGIMNLTKEYDLSKEEDDYIGHDTEVLFGLVGELAIIIEAYSENPYYSKERKKESIELWIQEREEDFEQGLNAFLRREWLTPSDSVHYSKFIKDCKNKIRKKWKRGRVSIFKREKKRGRKVPEEKVRLEGYLVSEFHNCSKISSIEKILHYVAHLLTYCKIEKGSHMQVFERIKKRRQRHWDDVYLTDSMILQR
jgi:hypothetical protein